MPSLKGPDICIPSLIGKPEQQRFTIQSSIMTALAVGSAAQSVAAYHPNERTLDLQSAARQTHLFPQPATLWSSPRNGLWQWLTIYSREYYWVLIAIHLAHLSRRLV